MLRNNAEVAEYIADPRNGFEKLNKLLRDRKIEHFFVYGTLLNPGTQNWQQEANATYVADGKIRARLYDLGDYPGAIPSIRPGECVTGKLFRLKNPQSAFRTLDAYEDFFPLNPDRKNLFVRVAVPVATENAEDCFAWTYFYNERIDEAQRIHNGRYKK